ncbi:MAG: hypothetical protein JXR97_01495, partial [Planctomycetes bacterium]|nr:hypothetical protein [Planctomycetota bacterium]
MRNGFILFALIVVCACVNFYLGAAPDGSDAKASGTYAKDRVDDPVPVPVDGGQMDLSALRNPGIV